MARNKTGINKALNNVLESNAIGWGVVSVVIVGGVILLFKGRNLINTLRGNVDALIDRGDIKKDNPGTTNTDYKKAYEIAKNVADALNTTIGLSWYQSLDEDEKTASYWLNKIESVEQSRLVKSIYKNLTGYDLYYHITEYFDFVQIKWVDTQILNYLK